MRYFIIAIFSILLEAKTLQETIDYSLEHNYQIQILLEQKDIDNRQADIDGVWSDPILKVGINDIQSDNPLNRDDEAMQNQFIAISQTIPLSNRLKISSDIAKKRAEVVDKKIDILRVDIAFNIREAFIDASYAKKRLSIIDDYISFLETPMRLLVNLSAVDRSRVEDYIKTQLLKESYQLKRESLLETIEIAKESIELIGNLKIDIFDTEPIFREYNRDDLDILLEKISLNNPKLQMVETLEDVAKKSLSLAKAKERADITVTGGVYQRFNRDDYISISVSYPLFVRNRQSNQKLQAIKRVNIQNIRYAKTKVELEQSLKIAIRRLKYINQELNILYRSQNRIIELIDNAKSELSIGGTLIHYYELFTKKIDNLLAINQKELKRAKIQNKIMYLLGD
jgi:outer membrane protein TolC